MQGKTLNRVMAIGAAAAGLIFAVPALAQESATEFTSLAPIEDIITNFESGVPTVGLTIATTDANAAIRSQFQIMVNFAPRAVPVEEDVALTPSGFVEDSTTEIESVAQHFAPPDEMRWLPPLHPWIDPYSRVAIASGLDGWTVYGEEGLVEGTEDAFEPLQSVWGIELAEPFDTTCSQTAFVGRAWAGSSVTSGSDPLFTAAALGGRYGGDSHEALADTASRIVELTCLPGGEPTVFQYRMKEEGGVRFFGPTSTIAMVKGTSVVFFSPVRIHDGDLRQQFFATPPGGGQVEAALVEDEPKLLVPNPYAEFGTKVTIVPIEEPAAEAAADTAEGLRLLHTSADGSSIRAQSGGGCTPRADEVFLNAFTAAALHSGFAQRESLPTIGDFGGLLEFEFPDGTRQRILIGDDDLDSPEQWELEIIGSSGPSCTTAVELVSAGESLAVPSDATDDDATTEEPSETSADGGTTPAEDAPDATGGTTDEGGTVPWVPIGLAIAVAGGAGYAYSRIRKKPPSTPPPVDASDSSTSPAPVPPPTAPSGPEEPQGPRTFSAEDRTALQEVYKGADEAGLKVVGIAEITRLEDVKAKGKDSPDVIGKAVKIEVGVATDGSLVAPNDAAAKSTLSVEAIPSLELDSDGDEHTVWNAYTTEVDEATGSVTTTRSGPSADEWEALVDGRSDAEIASDPEFKDRVVETGSDSAAEAVRIALSKR